MTVEGQKRLFHLMRGITFTLLNFGAKQSVELASDIVHVWHVVRQPTHLDEIVDLHGYLARAYGARDHTLVLIRPDGYIALISDAGDTSAVSSYLRATNLA